MQSIYSKPLVIGNPGPELEANPIKPIHRFFPYRPDSIIDGWGTEQFILRAASLRGHSHRFYGVPRQDDFAVACHHVSGHLIIAVADGVSSSPQSHLGAAIAVRYAVEAISEKFTNGEIPASINWLELFHKIALQLIDYGVSNLGIDKKLAPQEIAEQAEKLLATTLICAIIESVGGDSFKIKIHAASVGDSSLWLLTGDTYTNYLGSKDDSSSSIVSATVFALPRLPEKMTPLLIEMPENAVLLMGTDGFGDPLGTGEGAVGLSFAKKLEKPPSMIEFAHILDFSRETFDDDRTLVAVWPRSNEEASTG